MEANTKLDIPIFLHPNGYPEGERLKDHYFINIIGNPIEPVVKLTANPLTAKLMSEHVDCDVSKILSREMNLDQAGNKLIDTTLKVANGRLTCAEALGHREFVMTKLYRSA